MFDGLKIEINDPVTNAHLLNIFDFISSHKESGEVIDPGDNTINSRFKYKFAEYKKLRFKLYDGGRLEITGSLHYYFNNGLHNYNQFTLNDVAEAINNFCREFKINPFTARIHNLEFGVNIELPFVPDNVIRNVVTHKTNVFNMMNINDGFGKTSLIKGAHYGVKIYNKSLQFKLTTNLLRYELKYVKMQNIGKLVYLADLINAELIAKCKTLLLDSFNDLIIKEPVNKLTDRDQIFYNSYINPNYHKEQNCKHKRGREKKKYNELLKNHCTNPIKEITRKLLVESLQKFTSVNLKNRNLLTDIGPSIFRVSHTRENLVSQPFDHLVKLSKGCIVIPPIKQPVNCISCGRDITKQKAGSKYCSEKLFGKEAKKCRNQNSNPRNNFKRKIEHIKSNGILFDIGPFIKRNPTVAINNL